MDNQCEETEEDASLYIVGTENNGVMMEQVKADFGLKRRPFSPPFKIVA